MLAADLLNRMSSESREDETKRSLSPWKSTAEGKDFVIVVGGEERQDRRGSWKDGGHGKISCSNQETGKLDRCPWRRSEHHQRFPSKTDALSSSSSSQLKPANPARFLKDAERFPSKTDALLSSSSSQLKPANPARFLKDTERLSASRSSPRQPKIPLGLHVQVEPVTSFASDVSQISDHVDLRSSLYCGKGFEPETRRRREELGGGSVGAGTTEIENGKRETIEKKKGGRGDKRTIMENRRMQPISEAVRNEIYNEISKRTEIEVEFSDDEKSLQENEKDKKKEEGRKKEEEEEEWRSEVSSSLIEFVDAMNEVPPEDKISQPMIREEQISDWNVTPLEPSETVTMELRTPRTQKQDGGRLQQMLDESVPRDCLQTADGKPDVATTRCHEKQSQHVAIATGSHASCVHKELDSVQLQNSEERIPEKNTEISALTKLQTAKARAICRLKLSSNSFAPRRHIPPSSVRSVEPQVSPSNNNTRTKNRSVLTNERAPGGRGVRVREVIIGDSKIRLISKRNHPPPTRASILRQVAAVSSSSSSSTSSFTISSSSGRSPGSDAAAARCNQKTPIARILSKAMVLIPGPFAKDQHQLTANNRKTPASLNGNSPRSGNSPDSINLPSRSDRTKYQTTRTFLVNRNDSPGGSPKRHSASSTLSPRRDRPTPAESEGRRPRTELQKAQPLQPRRTFFVHSNRQNNSGHDVLHYHHHRQLLQQRQSFTVRRTATRTLVTSVSER